VYLLLSLNSAVVVTVRGFVQLLFADLADKTWEILQIDLGQLFGSFLLSLREAKPLPPLPNLRLDWLLELKKDTVDLPTNKLLGNQDFGLIYFLSQTQILGELEPELH
jgi:hypothetical protein